MRTIDDIVSITRSFGLEKDLDNPKLIISSKPVIVDNKYTYKEIRVSHFNREKLLNCIKRLHQEFGEDVSFLDKIDLRKKRKYEYSGNFGEYSCKAIIWIFL